MAKEASPPVLHLSAAEVRSWEAEYVEIDAKIERLRRDQTKLQEKIAAVRLLAPSLFLDDGSARKDDNQGLQLARKGRPTWTGLIEEHVRSSGDGIVQKDLLASIRGGVFGDRLKTSESGYYNAIQKLLTRGLLKKRGDRLFTPAQFSDYMTKVERGEVEDVVAVEEYGSPSAAIAVNFIKANPGCESPQVIAAIWKASGSEQRQSKTSLYNMIARLAEQQHIRKVGKKLYPYDQNEPPSFPGGSEAGKVTAFPKRTEQDDHGDLLSYRS